MLRVPGKRPTREGASAGRGWRWSASPTPFPPAGVRVLGSALTDVLVGGLPRFGLATCGDAGRPSVGHLGSRGGKGLSWLCAVAHTTDTGSALACPAEWDGVLPAAGGATRSQSVWRPQHGGDHQQGSRPSSVEPGSGAPGVSVQARGGSTPASPGAASWRRPGCHPFGEHSGGPRVPEHRKRMKRQVVAGFHASDGPWGRAGQE